MSNRINRSPISVVPTRFSSLAARAAIKLCIAVKSISGIVSTTAPSLAIPVLTTMAATGCAFTYSPPSDWTHYKLAQELEQAGNYKEAIKEYKTFISEDPSNLLVPDAQHEIAYIYDYKLNDYPNAVVEYRKMVDNYPNNGLTPHAQYRVAVIYDDKLKEYDNAKEEYRLVVANYHDSTDAPRAQFRIAEILEKNLPHWYNISDENRDSFIRDSKNAADEYSNVYKYYPESRYLASEALFRGSILLNSIYVGEYEKGNSMLELLVAKYPESANVLEAQFEIAEFYRIHRQDYQRAIIEYRKVVDGGYPNAPLAQLFICDLLDENLHDYPNAIHEYSTFIRRFPDNTYNYIYNSCEASPCGYAPNIQFRIAQIYDEILHDYPNAVIEYKKVISNYPNSNYPNTYDATQAEKRLKELCDMGYC